MDALVKAVRHNERPRDLAIRPPPPRLPGCGGSPWPRYAPTTEYEVQAVRIETIRRALVALVLLAVSMLPFTVCVGAATELQVIRTANVGDVVVTLLGATGAWTTGDNTFVVEVASAPRKRLIDVGVPALTATLPSATVRPVRASARIERGDVPGRYVGRITLASAGEWSVTVAWSRAGSKESATLPILVQAARKGARG